MRPKKRDLKDWESMVSRMKNSKKPVKVAIVGKYFQTGDFVLTDSYLSVIEAIKHASWNNILKPEIEWFSAEEYEKNPSKVKELKDYDGIIIPGGFGSRGIEGKIKVIKFCRENNIPFLGLCLGMQMAVIEFARNICGIKDANSSEIDPKCSNPVITLIGDQVDLINNKKYGATMRLGAYPCILKDYTISYSAYKTKEISERHRHRYELNNDYRTLLESKGLVMAGINPERDLVEIIELKNHPFFVGTQFHPEFKSTPLVPHPLFNSFILACKKRAN
jgi:CTP synthase